MYMGIHPSLLRAPVAQLGYLTAVSFLMIACGASAKGPPSATPAPAATATSVEQRTAPVASSPAAVSPAATASPVPTAVPTSSAVRSTSARRSRHDPNATMFRLFSGPDQLFEDTLGALDEAGVSGDTAQVPVILELMRMIPARELLIEGSRALSGLTGEDFGTNTTEWTRWLGKHASEYQPPDRYLEWKITLMSLVDPRFADLLGQASEGVRIDLTEVLWGGVHVDGIPPLEHAPTVPAAEAAYLNPDDRVFGVSINGEHRAYPLRIINAHEMANDTLGGEPISLAY